MKDAGQLCAGEKLGWLFEQICPWLDPLGNENDFRKEARRLSYTETHGSLWSQMLILLHVQIQAAASNQSPVPGIPWVLLLRASSFLREALYVWAQVY